MVFQFILCQRKIIKQREKKLSVTELLTFTKGSVSFQAISSPDRFLAISVQLRTAKIMWDGPKDSWNIRYACIWIFQTKYFHECNHMKEKKKDPSHFWKPSFTHFRICLWTNDLYWLDCLFPSGLHGLCPKKCVPAALTLHLTYNISPHGRTTHSVTMIIHLLRSEGLIHVTQLPYIHRIFFLSVIKYLFSKFLPAKPMWTFCSPFFHANN